MRPRGMIQSVLLLTCAAMLGACRGSDGTIYYPVIGLGVVGVKDPIAASGGPEGVVTAQRTEVLGIVASPGAPVAGLVAGYLQVQSVSAGPAAEALVRSICYSDGRWVIVIQPVSAQPAAASPAVKPN